MTDLPPQHVPENPQTSQTPQSGDASVATSSIVHDPSVNKVRLIVSCVVVFLIVVVTATYVMTRKPKTEFSEAVSLSNLAIDQEPLREYVIDNLKDGVNDDTTKQALFLISHRFFDNGGDIYEIYDFINSHDEVAFLREAETIEPEVFQLIKDKKVTAYDTPSTLALLSYFEVAMDKGYANFSMLGLGANKYAELAYNYRRLSQTFGSSTTQMDSKEVMGQKMVNKSLMFSKAADELIKKHTDGTYELKRLETAGFIDEDLLVGLNQFASAQYYYFGMGDPVVTRLLPGDIFEFNSDFARLKVPRLYMFTSYLWAVGNVYSGSLNTLSVAEPLTRVIEYGRANKDDPRPAGSMTRIINSRTSGEKSVFSHENAKLLAKTYKPFKDWLIETGWTEKDFK